MRLPGVMRVAVEGGGARGLAVMARSSRLWARWGSRARTGSAGRVPPPRRLSRMVGRRLACRDAPRLASASLNPQERTSSRCDRGLSDALGSYPTISRTAALDAAAPRTSRRAPRPRERRLEHRDPTAHE